MLAIAVGLSACGPLVPTGADGDTGGDTSEDGRATVAEEVGGEVGEDGVPPNPSDPSGPSDATADPDTGITVTATVSTTEPPPEGCGDGVVDPDEECDDGDVDDGDACSSQCTITFEVDWTVSHDGVASSFDVANDLVVGPGDEVYVVGASRAVAATSDVWLQQILPDGTLGWTFLWDGAEGLADEGAAIAWTAQGHLVIVGSTESELTGSDVLVKLSSGAWTRTSGAIPMASIGLPAGSRSSHLGRATLMFPSSSSTRGLPLDPAVRSPRVVTCGVRQRSARNASR